VTYAIVEVFHTIQGEGFHAGTPAVFVRLAACNLWSGRAEHRERDAERHAAKCPRWCDTDFVMREQMTIERLMDAVDALPKAPLCVLTGGEPLLQVDEDLVYGLSRRFRTIAVETNGTQPCEGLLRKTLWLTMSPKVAPSKIKLRDVDELKVVFPDYDPQSYLDDGIRASHCFVQPRAACTVETVGRSLLHAATMSEAAAYVMAHPHWRLSIQTHKLVGVP